MVYLDQLVQRRKHADPLALAQSQTAAESEERQRRIADHGVQTLRIALLMPGFDDIRESVLDDLRSFFTDSYFASANHQELKVREETAMWSINLLWYAYMQAEGFAHSVQAEVAAAAAKARSGARHLDFGSGVGVTSQLFHGLGYGVDLADTEDNLVAFAAHRLRRRGIDAGYVHLRRESPPRNSYNVVTAIDTLTFVPDFRATATQIRESMRLGGVLFANFDTRHGAQIGWPILHFDDYWLRQRLQEVGFEAGRWLGSGIRQWHAVETQGMGHLARRARDAVLFPARRTYRATRARLGVKAG